MSVFFENRGGYRVACYSVDIDQKMKERALRFAVDIIRTDNQYCRLLPAEVRNENDVDLQQKIRIQRTYLGKLGEMSFLKLLQEQGKNVKDDGMFEVYDGQGNVDNFDFITATGETVDIKTGFRHNHTRLVINTEQFDGDHKDYYVAVKINARDVDAINRLVDWNDISVANILGYAEYRYLRDHADIRDFGEGPAKFIPYDRLMGINRLLRKF